MKFKTLIIILSLIIFTSSDLFAQKITTKKYLSIRTSIANLRIGPSSAHPIAFVYEKKNMPVEVIDEFEVWRKVKDYQGDIGWLHLSQLSRKRTLLTTKDGIVLFKNSTLYSKPIIKIGNLEAAVIKKCIPNW
jgi:SH3-like domain-containing protein